MSRKVLDALYAASGLIKVLNRGNSRSAIDDILALIQEAVDEVQAELTLTPEQQHLKDLVEAYEQACGEYSPNYSENAEFDKIDKACDDLLEALWKDHKTVVVNGRAYFAAEEYSQISRSRHVVIIPDVSPLLHN